MIPSVAQPRAVALNFELQDVVRCVVVDQFVQALSQHDLNSRRIHFPNAEIPVVFAWSINSAQLNGFSVQSAKIRKKSKQREPKKFHSRFRAVETDLG